MINGDLLLALRTERGLSQRKLAKLVGVNGITILQIEHGGDTSELPSQSSVASLTHSTSTPEIF